MTFGYKYTNQFYVFQMSYQKSDITSSSIASCISSLVASVWNIMLGENLSTSSPSLNIIKVGTANILYSLAASGVASMQILFLEQSETLFNHSI
jgi:hypothetical protein